MRKPKSPPATPAEAAEWRALREAGWSFRKIARSFGRSPETIRYQVDPLQYYRRAEARERRQAAEA